MQNTTKPNKSPLVSALISSQNHIEVVHCSLFYSLCFSNEIQVCNQTQFAVLRIQTKPGAFILVETLSVVMLKFVAIITHTSFLVFFKLSENFLYIMKQRGILVIYAFLKHQIDKNPLFILDFKLTSCLKSAWLDVMIRL